MRFFVWALAASLAVTGRAAEGPPPLPAPDPDIVRLLAEISAERIQRSVFVLSSFKTRNTFSDPDPSADGIGAAAGWIRTQMEKGKADAGGRLQVTEDSFAQTPNGRVGDNASSQRVGDNALHPVMITNLVATLNGSRAGSAYRTYVVCAHYDSRARDVLDGESPAPGADDDASGVAALLELERVMARYDFPATIVFLAVAGEEQGGFGSAQWAREARARGADIEGMLNDDIIGNSRGPNGTYNQHRVRLFAQGVPPASQLTPRLMSLIATGGENDLPARQLARAIIDCAKVYVPGMDVHLVYRTDRYLRGGDQVSFLEQGYPAVRFTEAWEDRGRERPEIGAGSGAAEGDVPDALDYVYVADVARVNGAALASLARAPEPPRAAEIEAARPENDTTLRWLPNHEPDLAGYRVVWRDTTAAFWQHYRDLPAAQTSVTLPLSKDDVVFGLEAFDSAGHISQAVYPAPSRATP